MKFKTNSALFSAGVFSVALLLTGCAVNNNHRTPEEFSTHLIASGVPVAKVQRLDPSPFRATEAVAIEIEGQEIGVYKYNQDTEIQRKRIEKFGREKCTYIVGIKYPIVVHGSFMILGAEKNQRKNDIIKALETFE